MKLIFNVVLLLGIAILTKCNRQNEPFLQSEIMNLDEIDNGKPVQHQKILKLLYYVNEAIDYQTKHRKSHKQPNDAFQQQKQNKQTTQQYLLWNEDVEQMSCNLNRHDYKIWVAYNGYNKKVITHLQFNNQSGLFLSNQMDKNNVVYAYLNSQFNLQPNTKLFSLVDIVIQLCKGRFHIQTQQNDILSNKYYRIVFDEKQLSYLTPQLQYYQSQVQIFNESEQQQPSQHQLYVQQQIQNQRLQLQNSTILMQGSQSNYQNQYDSNKQISDSKTPQSVIQVQQHEQQSNTICAIFYLSIISMIALIGYYLIPNMFPQSHSDNAVCITYSAQKCRYNTKQFAQHGSTVMKKASGDWSRIVLPSQCTNIQLKFRIKSIQQWPIYAGISMNNTNNSASQTCILYSSDRTFRVANQMELSMGYGFKMGQIVKIIVDKSSNNIQWLVQGEVRFVYQLQTKIQQQWKFIIDVRGVNDAIQLI